MSTRNPPACPLCHGPGVALGRLGALRWYRCRDCGMDFNRRLRASARSKPTRPPPGDSLGRPPLP